MEAESSEEICVSYSHLASARWYKCHQLIEPFQRLISEETVETVNKEFAHRFTSLKRGENERGSMAAKVIRL
jgi:hypothetical protein